MNVVLFSKYLTNSPAFLRHMFISATCFHVLVAGSYTSQLFLTKGPSCPPTAYSRHFNTPTPVQHKHSWFTQIHVDCQHLWRYAWECVFGCYLHHYDGFPSLLCKTIHWCWGYRPRQYSNTDVLLRHTLRLHKANLKRDSLKSFSSVQISCSIFNTFFETCMT